MTKAEAMKLKMQQKQQANGSVNEAMQYNYQEQLPAQPEIIKMEKSPAKRQPQKLDYEV